MKTDPAKRDMTKYYEFHIDHRHRIDDCIQLKKEIEFLIRRGHLRRYVAPEDRNQAPPPPPHQPAPARHQQPLGEISDSDMEGCQHPHDDPLVIRADGANKTVHRVLIENGSSTDIIFASTFDKMGIEMEKLESVNAHLLGFFGEKLLPLGSV